MPDEPRPILLTAFEPSGDDLAAAVVLALLALRPGVPIFAWAGAKTAAAGATVVERTGADAIVGLPGVGKIVEHVRLNRRIGRWMDEHRPVLHVPVDSPAANFPICKMAKRRGMKVVHLAAPQLWAWAPWRIRKLRRCTDHVLCLLPFEEDWFRSRGVPATFIGHPLFGDRLQPKTIKLESDPGRLSGANDRPFRLLVAPGSRPLELRRHLPMILEVLREVSRGRSGIEVRFAVQDESAADRVRELAAASGALPAGAEIEAGADAIDHVAAWADAALAKSGTVTLRLARARLPMVVFYRTWTLGYLLVGRWLLTGEHHAMPNLVAGRRIVDEFVPHVGSAAPIAAALGRLIDDEPQRSRQREDLDSVARLFEGRDAAAAAASKISEYYNMGNGPGGG